MMYVERNCSKGIRSRKFRKNVGFSCHWSQRSDSDWNKKEFGSRWLVMMIWNQAARKVEGGIIRGTVEQAYYNRYPPKNFVSMKFQTNQAGWIKI